MGSFHVDMTIDRTELVTGEPDLPTIAIFSSLFPSSVLPNAGLFIRERMFRLRPYARGLVVVAPQPWFPFQSLLRFIKPGYRPVQPTMEVQSGVTVVFPRFLSVPGWFRWLDSLSMALCVFPLMRRLCREMHVGILDAHFAYPCGHAAILLGRWLRLPVSITLRGTESAHLRVPRLRKRVISAVRNATRVFSVSDSLRQLLVGEGVPPEQIHVVGNGIDLVKFQPIDRHQSRRDLGLPDTAKVLVSVGGLVERKGFHRIIELLPMLICQLPDLYYLIIGGASPEGDMSAALRQQVHDLNLDARVIFTGPLPPEHLCVPLSAADVFVLATRNEGWANVFLEAMACGLPVVTTDVGGNAEVICSPSLGLLVPFGDTDALRSAIRVALERDWDRPSIIAYAQGNTWDERVTALVTHFREIAAETGISTNLRR